MLSWFKLASPKPQLEACSFHHTTCSLLSPHPACSFPGYYLYTSLSPQPTHFVQPLLTVLDMGPRWEDSGWRAGARGRGGGVELLPAAPQQGTSGLQEPRLVSDPRVQPSRTHRWPSSRTALDRRSPLGPDKKEFCFLSIFLQLSPCEGCSRRCLGQVVEFSCCPVTWLEAENDPCHLAP